MTKGNALCEAYKILSELIAQHIEKNTIPSEVLNELEALRKNSLSYSNVVKERAFTEDWPQNTGDDVILCPRCRDQDVLPGHRICFSCGHEISADYA